MAQLKSTRIETPLGILLAISDNENLFLLAFSDSPKLNQDIATLCHRMSSTLVPGMTEPLHSIKHELEKYFSGKRTCFETQISMMGTPFQKKTWDTLLNIPIGETRSYAEIAKEMDAPKAFRAVGNANGANPLVIIVPCHRVICTDGRIGGYGCGISRKRWLLRHEEKPKGKGIKILEMAELS